MTLEVSRAQVIGYRWRAQQLDRAPGAARSADDVALLDYGVQDTGPSAARWALANRGLESYDDTEMLLAWTLRVSPHLYRRSDLAAVSVAAAPFDEKDAAKRVFDASKPLREAGIEVLDALRVIGRTQREIVERPTVKGELSTKLTERLDPPYLRHCVPCGATHVWESTFRMSALQGGLDLEPGTSPPVLRRIPRFTPSLFRTPGSEAGERFDVVRNYLRFHGPARPHDVAGFLDAPVREIKEHWPEDALPVVLPDLPEVKGERFVLEGDAESLAGPAERSGTLRLLGPYDGYVQLRERASLVGDAGRAKELWRTLGRPGAVALDGEVIGTWRPRSAGRKLNITWEPWTTVTRAQQAAFREQAERLAGVRGQELANVVAAD